MADEHTTNNLVDGEQVDMTGSEETIQRKKSLLTALEAKYGIVTDACREQGVERSTFYKWLKIDPAFKAAVDDIQEVALDYVEGKLFERITGVEVIKGVDKETGEPTTYSLPPDVQAIGLYLKTKGKKRGYYEKTESEVYGKDGANIQPVINISVVKPGDAGGSQ
jgi:hypothetical protein